MRRPKPVHQMTVAQFEAMFPDEEACKAYLVARRWPNGVKCPRCGFEGFPLAGRNFHWQCYNCAPQTSYRFSCIAGTIFENTNKPLREWFRVVHLMLTSKKGISALQVQRMMGFGSYGTAHSMCHKIRAALIEPETKLGGIVEVDETWVGGKDANRHWDKKHHGKTGLKALGRTPVIGAVQRKGNVIARVLDRVTKSAAESFMREMVSDKVSLLATDESFVYDCSTEYPRQAVEHQAKRYVVGAVHTNTIEGFWSIFKRGIAAPSTKSARNTCRCTSRNFSSATIGHNADIFGAAIEGC